MLMGGYRMGRKCGFQALADKISDGLREITDQDEMLLVKHINGRYYLIGKKDGKAVLCANNGYRYTEFEALLNSMLSNLKDGQLK